MTDLYICKTDSNRWGSSLWGKITGTEVLVKKREIYNTTYNGLRFRWRSEVGNLGWPCKLDNSCVLLSPFEKLEWVEPRNFLVRPSCRPYVPLKGRYGLLWGARTTQIFGTAAKRRKIEEQFLKGASQGRQPLTSNIIFGSRQYSERMHRKRVFVCLVRWL